MAYKIPSDLIDYLVTMISPPAPHKPVEFWDWIDTQVWDELYTIADCSMTGIILRVPKGQPTPEQSTELLRILMPGAHLLLIPPDEQPTGHTAACTVEDAGFEIRNAICLINDSDDSKKLHYAAKAVRSEREAGCFGLPTKTGFEAVGRQEGSIGTRNAAAGVNRSAGEVANSHPCVKNTKLMVRLLGDVPKGQGPVLDPFLGSGTTAIACVKTGHDFIGIERESEYVTIAGARVRHWKDEHLKGDRWDDVSILVDEVAPVENQRARPKSAIEDLFGG